MFIMTKTCSVSHSRPSSLTPQDRSVQPKITPWLWRLADDENVGLPQLPEGPREQLLQALAEASAGVVDEDVKLGICMSISTHYLHVGFLIIPP